MRALHSFARCCCVQPLPLWVIERDHIQKVLEKVEGNKSKAAKVLEIDRKTLYTKLERYGLPT